MNSYNFKIEDREYAVSVLSVNRDCAEVVVNGTKYDVQLSHADTVDKDDSRIVSLPAQDIRPTGNLAVISSPIPGILVEIHVSVGQKVRKGETVAVVEAMKMENDIQSECDGVVESVSAAKGDSLMEGSPVIVIRT